MPTSVRPAASARERVASLRPSDAQSTSAPPARSAAPTAAPISPGCSSPTRVGSAGGLPGRPGPASMTPRMSSSQSRGTARRLDQPRDALGFVVGGAGRGVRNHPHGDVEGRVGLALLAHDGEHLAHVVGRDRLDAAFAEADRRHAVAPRGAPQGTAVGPDDSHPHRDARRLHRSGEERGPVDGQVPALEREALTRPEAEQHLETLVEALGAHAVVGRLAEGTELGIGWLAQAHAEHGPPAREMVEGDRLAGQLPGPPPGNRRHHRAQPDALGRLRDGAQHDPGIVDRERVVGVDEHVVPEEEAVPTRALGRVTQLDEVGRVAEVGDADPVAHERRR